MASITAEDLYLDRLPWEDVYEGDSRPRTDSRSVREVFLFSFRRDPESYPFSHIGDPPSSWAEYDWPFLHTRLVNYMYPDMQQFSYWLPEHAEALGAALWEQAAIAGDKHLVFDVFGGVKGREKAVEPEDSLYSNEESRSTAYDESPRGSVSESVTARKVMPTSANYKARLSLLPRFVREVLARPFSDFTLLKRGNEVFVIEEGVDLSGKDLSGVDLHRANLRKATLKGANLSDAMLRGADLRGANLKDAILDDADLREADLRGIMADTQALSRAVTDGALLSGDRPLK